MIARIWWSLTTLVAVCLFVQASAMADDPDKSTQPESVSPQTVTGKPDKTKKPPAAEELLQRARKELRTLKRLSDQHPDDPVRWGRYPLQLQQTLAELADRKRAELDAKGKAEAKTGQPVASTPTNTSARSAPDNKPEDCKAALEKTHGKPNIKLMVFRNSRKEYIAELSDAAITSLKDISRLIEQPDIDQEKLQKELELVETQLGKMTQPEPKRDKAKAGQTEPETDAR